MPATFALPGFVVRRLRPEDITLIADLARRASDYTEMITGEPARPDEEAAELFDVLPPGKKPEDLWLIGVLQGAQLVALLEIVHNSPAADEEYLGLLLMDPTLRGSGLGRRVYQGYAGRAWARGVRRIVLSVVQENQRALRFWQSVGFEPTDRSLPEAQYGAKTHRVHELQHVLPAAPHRRQESGVERYLDGEGRVTVYPSQHQMKRRVLTYLGSKFELGREYTEREVNEVLRAAHTFDDPALLRRDMFELGVLGRATNGSRYWRKPEGE
ncbi:hypothetical protein DAETH_48760 (plasmid) [Deinococcus aetherius]|uniref:N-acetyltransferase domain-containing protein n=1 Tax=Deinococcus aetherius TaxID=200252 RepID=A0ABM8AM52_9DEIO|nr:GNAT family N-acetyltransferase [Deinococcus aetherius]BDP44907.1 hypothetical protein DAETH_48760 [Deinococcus aetherius]